jgi:protein subunit release factor A
LRAASNGGSVESNNRYQNVLTRFDQLGEELGKPEIIKNRDLYRKTARERSDLEKAVLAIRRYLDCEKRYAEDRAAVEQESDREIVELARS